MSERVNDTEIEMFFREGSTPTERVHLFMDLRDARKRIKDLEAENATLKARLKKEK